MYADIGHGSDKTMNFAPKQKGEPMDDLISRQAAIESICTWDKFGVDERGRVVRWHEGLEPYVHLRDVVMAIEKLPSAQPTLYGYNIEHLELIARALQREDLPPERVVEALKDIEDIGRFVAVVMDVFEKTLRKAVEQCTI